MFLYYEEKNGRKEVVVYSREKIESLGDNFIIADIPEDTPRNARLLIDNNNKVYWEKIPTNEEKIEEIKESLEASKELISNVLNLLVLNDATDEQKEALLEGKRVWTVGEVFNGGEIIQHKGVLYEVIKYHVSQADWEPGTIGGATLYKESLNLSIKGDDGEEVEVIADFVQPTGAHDAYSAGDKVRFEGKIYECKKDNTVHSPEEYPDGWNLIED